MSASSARTAAYLGTSGQGTEDGDGELKHVGLIVGAAYVTVHTACRQLLAAATDDEASGCGEHTQYRKREEVERQVLIKGIVSSTAKAFHTICLKISDDARCGSSTADRYMADL